MDDVSLVFIFIHHHRGVHPSAATTSLKYFQKIAPKQCALKRLSLEFVRVVIMVVVVDMEL